MWLSKQWLFAQSQIMIMYTVTNNDYVYCLIMKFYSNVHEKRDLLLATSSLVLTGGWWAIVCWIFEGWLLAIVCLCFKLLEEMCLSFYGCKQFWNVIILLWSQQRCHIPFLDCFLYFLWYITSPFLFVRFSCWLWKLWSSIASWMWATYDSFLYRKTNIQTYTSINIFYWKAIRLGQ